MSPRLLRPRASGDPDAGRYIAAVQAADGQALEPAVRQAIEAFVRGCKADGIWSAIKASCLLMGARTLSGALTPLVGPSPTNNGPFVSGDYNRKTGLLGDGTTKFLNSNRANNVSGQNDRHSSVYVTTLPASGGIVLGAGSNIAGATNLGRGGTDGNAFFARSVPLSSTLGGDPAVNNSYNHSVAVNTGFWGLRRASGTEFSLRAQGVTDLVTATGAGVSGTPSSDNLFVFARNNGSGTAQSIAAARLAWYSLGDSLDLSLLDGRVTTLYNAIHSAVWNATADADARAYVAAVELADGQSLEPAVKDAIETFIVGCKADGIWSAIKASCILMGARTLSGALTPLVGNAVTNNGPFVSGDYNRKTGLIGNGTSKYLTTTNPVTPQQNNVHHSCYITDNTLVPANQALATHIAAWPTSGTDGRTQISSDLGRTFTRCRETTGNTVLSTSTGFVGISRIASADYTLRRASSNTTVTVASTGVPNQNVFIYVNPALAQHSDARLAFWSIGESLTLSSLDSRVSTLYTAIGAAIP